MAAELAIGRIVELREAQPATPLRGELIAIEADGTLRAKVADGREFLCAWLESAANLSLTLSPGDALLLLPPPRSGGGVGRGPTTADELGVVLGRIGRYRAPQPAAPQPNVTIEASETLTLKCGDATVDLRKDGKLMIRGEDVLLKAKGTQRIKAGTVNIN